MSRSEATTCPGRRCTPSSRLLIASLALLAACRDKEPPPQPSYVKPTPKAARSEGACAAVAKTIANARTTALDLVVGDGGTIAIADAAVLDGPFEAPIGAPARPGAHAVTVFTRGEAEPFCARIALADGEKAAERPLGTLVVDSDVVAIADATLAAQAVKDLPATLYAGVEGPAKSLAVVVPALPKDLALETVLPTLARSTRPLQPTDEAAIETAIRAAHVGGARFVAEPVPFAWTFVKTLDDAPAANVRLGASDHGAIALASSPGAFRVVADVDASGALLALELRLYD